VFSEQIWKCGDEYQGEEKLSFDIKVDGYPNELNSQAKECKW